MSEHILKNDATLLEAIRRLNELSGNAMTLFIADAEGKIEGTLTDGDIRRGLLAGLTLDSPAAKAANRQFHAILGSISADTVKQLRNLRESNIILVPRLDSDGHLKEIIDLRLTPNRLPLRALLMAGGVGERLRPLTLECPKPLLKIDGKAIIDYNIEALAAAGVTDITVATRYLAEKIEKHFAKPVAGVNVKCILEAEPMGTIGAASFLKKSDDGETLVMNSDLITSVSFEEMYIKHSTSNSDITIAVVPYQVAVPYAILTLDGEKVVGLEEKPSYSYYANAGIYMIKNSVLSSIPSSGKTDATDLIERVISQGGNVAYYPIKGTWIDVGSPTDFRQASELMRHHRNLTHK